MFVYKFTEHVRSTREGDIFTGVCDSVQRARPSQARKLEGRRRVGLLYHPHSPQLGAIGIAS